jgi:hypothetical protein
MFRRKRLGDMLSELDANGATLPNEISPEALRSWSRTVARRGASDAPRPR